MSKLTQPMKLNNAILRLLLASKITNDEYMAIVRKLDALTALALRTPERPVRTTSAKLSPELEHDTIMFGTKWGDDR